MAAEKGHLQVIQKLLQGGANVDHQNKVMTIHSSYMYNRIIEQLYEPIYLTVTFDNDSACMMGPIAWTPKSSQVLCG